MKIVAIAAVLLALYLLSVDPNVTERIAGFSLAIFGGGWMRLYALGALPKSWDLDRRSIIELVSAPLIMVVTVAAVGLGRDEYFGYLEERFFLVILFSMGLNFVAGFVMWTALNRMKVRKLGQN